MLVNETNICHSKLLRLRGFVGFRCATGGGRNSHVSPFNRGLMMTFTESVTSVFQKYASFSGRATRSEYWWFALFSLLVQVAIGLFADRSTGLGLAGGLIALGMFIPSLAVSSRRLHDIDKSGWWMLIVLVPILGGILLLIWTCTKGSLGENRFGPAPEK